jgi:SecD/SecF fusion protein|tara:strand:- start:222470 stop:225109 length:2640 start_codon:yes stop_codon:yes gene_type:complete
MKGTHLARLFVSIAFLAWAAASLTPVNDTSYEDYLVERVTDRIDRDGVTLLLSQEENVEGFTYLLNRAQARVDATVADDAVTNSTLFIELMAITTEENIDLFDYYSDLRIRDIANLEKRNRLVLNRLLRDSKGSLQPGLDLAGGVSVTLQLPEESLQAGGSLRAQELEQARQVILNRIDAYGVAEPIVRIKGDSQIEIQIAGLDTDQNTEIITELIKPAKLEFSVVHRTQTPRLGPAPLGYIERIAERENPETGSTIEIPLFVKRIPIMTGDHLDRARATVTNSGGFEIFMDFTKDGGNIFSEVTAQMARENQSTNTIAQLAIILDNKVVSYPTVREQISGGSAVITGQFSQREAVGIATALNNPLSIDLEVAELKNVSGTLAEAAKSSSARAAMIGGGLVILFMLVWYGIAGISAVITVGLNIFLVMGSLAAFGATLTLPGVAALVLTIGMAVDATILIFERIREELRAGKSMTHAVTDGYEKAFSTIVDANVTTLITALVLIYFGTGPVRGFGLTLAIGIGSTIITALITSRLFMDALAHSGLMKGLPNRFSLLGSKERPLLKFARPAFLTSWTIVALGILALWLHWGQAFGIDFTGGDEVQVSYETALSDEELIGAANSAGFDQVNILRLSPIGSNTEVVTLQTEADLGAGVYDALALAYPEVGLAKIGVTQIGPSVGEEVKSGAIKAIAISLLAMLIYIAMRFEFGFGLGALTATVHDVLLTVGVFFALGEFLGIGSGQFTAPMIAAVLMTVGYSINDTIVVFDRVREELELNPGMGLKRVIHMSINRVLTRTILTSLTTLFASLALYLFGAGVIVDFALVFLIGVITGTFSSIFIASPIFYWYHKGDRKSVERGEMLPAYDWGADEPNSSSDKA